MNYDQNFWFTKLGTADKRYITSCPFCAVMKNDEHTIQINDYPFFTFYRLGDEKLHPW